MEHQRRRLGLRVLRISLASIVTSAAVLLIAAPAWAHHPVLSGTTRCLENNEHMVIWTIGNSETSAGHNMNIASATATVGGTSYPVAGYVSPVNAGKQTFAITTVPGNVSGTIRLTVNATWNDGASASRFVDVDLMGPCTPTTTPSTSPPTTTPPTTTPETTTPPTTTPETTTPPTTGPETTTTTGPIGGTTTTAPNEPTTTVPEQPTTTTGGPDVHDNGSTTTTNPPVTIGGSTLPPTSDSPVGPLGTPTSHPPTGSLPFTGSSGMLWAIIGIGLFALGLTMVVVPQRKSPARNR